MQGKNRYILTLLGRKLSARQISAVTRILAEQGMNIDAIKRLTGRIPLDECEYKVRVPALNFPYEAPLKTVSVCKKN